MIKNKKFIPTHFFIHCIDCGTLVKKFERKEHITSTFNCQYCGQKIDVWINHTFNYHNTTNMFFKIFKGNQTVVCSCIFNKL